ncbi:hypothetical protein JCM8202v2_003136 [Rhodotorula sphaerocarpa]
MQVRRSRPFHPPANRDSFKDLLVFEERLKQNAQRLQKQRRKYEAFLFTLTGVIAYLGYYVFVLPSIYSLVHYSNVAMLLVAATTLVLFFATGMYSEKIAYAHKFVPQANRALRPFNIYLNTRRKPRLAFLTRWFNSTPSPAGTASGPSSRSASPSGASTPAGHVRKGSASVGEASVPSEGRESGSAPLSRQTSTTSIESAALSDVSLSASSGGFRSPPASPPLPSQDLPSEDSRPPTPSRDPVTRAPSSPSPSPPPPSRTAVPLPPIPPSQNPRGELIFSSRVTPQFREGYERYRGEWERRRSEARKQQQGQLSGRVVARVYGRMGAVFSGFGRRFGSGGARAEEEKVAGAGREDAGSRSEKEGMLRSDGGGGLLRPQDREAGRSAAIASRHEGTAGGSSPNRSDRRPPQRSDSPSGASGRASPSPSSPSRSRPNGVDVQRSTERRGQSRLPPPSGADALPRSTSPPLPGRGRDPARTAFLGSTAGDPSPSRKYPSGDREEGLDLTSTPGSSRCSSPELLDLPSSSTEDSDPRSAATGKGRRTDSPRRPSAAVSSTSPHSLGLSASSSSTSTAPTSAPQTSTDISTTASASRVRAESFSDLLTLEGEATADGLNGTGLLGPAGRLPRLEGSNSMRRGG